MFKKKTILQKAAQQLLRFKSDRMKFG